MVAFGVVMVCDVAHDRASLPAGEFVGSET
jgi:hypothetical protein